MLAEAFQTTLEDAVPLSEVEFLIVDLKTTGGSPADCRITEIGAVKLRGGERTGVFETLVNPGVPIPRQITKPSLKSCGGIHCPTQVGKSLPQASAA